MKFPPASDVRRQRRSLGITQLELATAAGVSQGTVAKIESGRTSASYETMVRIFEALDRMRSGASGIVAADIASDGVMSVPSTEPLHTASEMMMREGHSQLPVIDDGVPVGSISQRAISNLLRSGMTMDQLSATAISEVMEEPFPVVADTTPLDAVAGLMAECDAVLVSRLGRIVGVITDADILKLIRRPGARPSPRSG